MRSSQVVIYFVVKLGKQGPESFPCRIRLYEIVKRLIGGHGVQ